MGSRDMFYDAKKAFLENRYLFGNIKNGSFQKCPMNSKVWPDDRCWFDQPKKTFGKFISALDIIPLWWSLKIFPCQDKKRNIYLSSSIIIYCSHGNLYCWLLSKAFYTERTIAIKYYIQHHNYVDNSNNYFHKDSLVIEEDILCKN